MRRLATTSLLSLPVLLIIGVAASLLQCSEAQVVRIYGSGALATSAPIATEVGKEVFKKGGNAFDVAVAVGFTLAVVHPEAGNIGGGGFAVVRDSSTGSVRALDFRETAPAAAYETMYLDEHGEVVADLATIGARACGVPGTVAGLHELWREYGSLPWETLVQKAAAIADTGFVVDRYLSESLSRYRERLHRFQETARVFYPEGRTPQPGFKLRQADLARTMRLISAEGPDGFYRGPVAELIVRCMEKHGGLITAEDLESYRPAWRAPVHFLFDSLDVYSMPLPSSGGIMVGQILKILEIYDFAGCRPSSPEYIHVFSEAAKLAFADRAQHLGDPAFGDVPATLLAGDYLKWRRDLIDKEYALPAARISAGVPPDKSESDQTTHFSVCDAQGNMVALTYTINTSYGSKLVVDGAGFLLNNEMDDFSAKPGSPNTYGLVGGDANKIEPGKRMLSSMAPTLVLKKGRPYLVLGSPGGSKIITIVAEALINAVRFGSHPKQVAEQPRFHHQWLPDELHLEEGAFDINVKQELIRRGHNVTERAPYGDLQMVVIDEQGMMIPISDPRGRGTADGVN